MSWLVALWWLSFWTAVGLCIGSFLNAVIYRLPRQRSVRNPLWSFCPHCQHRIRWSDNLPLVSFLLLRGRCRHCGGSISTRYFVIEAAMALVVLLLLDAFFVGGVRAGLAHSRFGLTDELASDWPIFLAHVILFSCLLSMSAIDLEHYWVDVRFTNFATLAGFVLHTIWTPRHSVQWTRPGDGLAAASVGAVAGLVLVWAVMRLQVRAKFEPCAESAATEPPPAPHESGVASDSPPPSSARSRLGVWAAGAMLALLFVGLLLDESGAVAPWHTYRALLPLVLFFAMIVRESTVARPSDQLIMDAIHGERHTARRTVLIELGLLTPAVVTGLAGWWLLSAGTGTGEAFRTALHSRIQLGPWFVTPLEGFATAASGYIIAGAVGWAVRIVFTLAFGKEAFGTGDIHLMAAAGCVAGWPVVVLGFFLTCGLAMIGWLLSLPFKWSRALPLGPWLSLSILAVVVFFDGIIRWPFLERAIQAGSMLMGGNSQVVPRELWP